MKAFRVCTVTGALFFVGGLFACGGSQKSPGVTNAQPAEPQSAPNVAPVREGQCLSSGTACTTSADCCSQWCANERCATRPP